MGKNSKPPSQRQLRVGEEIRHVMSDIFLQEEFCGSHLEGVSVTVSEVKVSPDLKNATVYVSALGGAAPEGFVESLNDSASQFRYILGKRVKLRYIPRIYFKIDDTYENAQRIESLLDSLKVPATSLENES